MKVVGKFKLVLAVLCFSMFLCAEAFAAATVTDTPEISVTKTGPSDKFPFEIVIDAGNVDRLCYAGHMQGGGIFYDDGQMILPGTKFAVAAGPAGEDKYYTLSAEVTLLYENPQHTGCTREIVRKYPEGSIEAGKLYEILTESTIRSLTQRNKLYSSDLTSIRVTITSGDRSKTALFYVAKDSDYAEAQKRK